MARKHALAISAGLVVMVSCFAPANGYRKKKGAIDKSGNVPTKKSVELGSHSNGHNDDVSSQYLLRSGQSFPANHPNDEQKKIPEVLNIDPKQTMTEPLSNGGNKMLTTSGGKTDSTLMPLLKAFSIELSQVPTKRMELLNDLIQKVMVAPQVAPEERKNGKGKSRSSANMRLIEFLTGDELAELLENENGDEWSKDERVHELEKTILAQMGKTRRYYWLVDRKKRLKTVFTNQLVDLLESTQTTRVTPSYVNFVLKEVTNLGGEWDKFMDWMRINVMLRRLKGALEEVGLGGIGTGTMVTQQEVLDLIEQWFGRNRVERGLPRFVNTLNRISERTNPMHYAPTLMVQ